MNFHNKYIKFKVNPEIKSLIIKKYTTVRHFADKIGYTESMLSHVLSGRRMIYPWMKEDFILFLEIPMGEERKYFEVYNDRKVS